MDRLQKAVARAKEKKGSTRPNSVLINGSQLDSADSVEQLETNVIEVPESQLAQQRVVASLDNITDASTFSFLRTKILSKMKANNWQTLAVCSPSPGQGKSTVAANLAVAMSMEVTQAAVLVDLDLNRPNQHQVFGIEPEFGVSDILRGEASVQDTLINPGIKRLSLLLGRGVMPEASKWMSDPIMHNIFEELSARYRTRFVIYDMPPLLKSDDTLKAIRNFDCSLLVVEDHRNTSEEIRQAMQIVQQTNYLGYVLNKVENASPLSGLFSR